MQRSAQDRCEDRKSLAIDEVNHRDQEEDAENDPPASRGYVLGSGYRRSSVGQLGLKGSVVDIVEWVRPARIHSTPLHVSASVRCYESSDTKRTRDAGLASLDAVNSVLSRQPVQNPGDVFAYRRGNALLRFMSECRNVWCEKNIGSSFKRARARRLLRPNIQGSASKNSACESFSQIFLYDHLAPRRVHEECRALHSREHAAVQETSGLRRARQVTGDDVGA